jgi:GDPmannose 4,6-dehydratase
MKTAVVLGSEGQDGRLLSAFLGSRGYRVIGVDVSPGSLDITSESEVAAFLRSERPDELYHLAAVHHSSESAPEAASQTAQAACEVNFLSLVYCLEGIRQGSPSTRLFYAASSHVFGDTESEVQDESTPLRPDSLYGLTKSGGVLACRTYRQAHGVFASAGILYNHESNLRPPGFLSRKIVRAAVEIRAGSKKQLALGSLSTIGDWGHAEDYVRAMHLILSHGKPDDFVVATGEPHTVQDFVRVAFEAAGLDWKRYVVEDRSIPLRRTPVRIGNPAKLMRDTGWRPTMTFEQMVKRLLEAEERNDR